MFFGSVDHRRQFHDLMGPHPPKSDILAEVRAFQSAQRGFSGMNNPIKGMCYATRESPNRGQATAINSRRSLLIVLVLLLTLGPLLGANRQATALFKPDRLSGENRYETAVKIGDLFTSLFQRTVYLSRSDQFADALAAGSLSDGPMLLIPSCNTIPVVVAEAIERWNPDRVVALGGEKAVCESSLLTLANGRPTDRISGADRIHTAIEIAKRSYADEMPQEIYLATAKDSPDALAMALSRSGPILLVGQQDPPPQALLNEIARFSSAKVVVVGGKAALPDSLIQKLVGGRSYERLSGENRYETAVRISQYLFPGSVTASNPPRDVYLARGDIYVDAVAAAMGWGSPLLLVPSCGQGGGSATSTRECCGHWRRVCNL